MKPQVAEIVPGMTVEEMAALYYDAQALREAPYKVYQLNSDGHRYYYRFDANGEPHFYPSVTTLLKQTMPTSPFLIEWMIKNGAEGSVEKRDLAAAYGTFMHAQFERLIINRSYNFDDVPGILLQYMEQNNLPDKFYGDSLTKIRKDVCAFAQFVQDYNVKPLAVEVALVHPDYRYAGMIDLPCVMTDPKTGEQFSAIVDFKSGRKGFYEEHEIQLHLYKMMWNANNLGMPISRVFSFSPKDWRGVKPTYNLKDQTDSPNAAKIPSLLQLAAIEDGKIDNTFTVIAGSLSLDAYNPKACITSLSLAELIKTKGKKEETPDVGFVPEQGESEPKKGVSVPEHGESERIAAEYDICEHHCKTRNCDYNFGSHGTKCEAAKAASEGKDNLDWLKTDDERAEAAAKAENKARTGRKTTKVDNVPPKKENAVKTDFSQKLLNTEIEL